LFLKSQVRALSWDQAIVLFVSLLGLSFNLSRSPQKERALASTSQIIDLGCLDSEPTKQNFFQRQPIIRLRGRLCSLPELGRFDSSLKIINSSSGKSGVVFLQGNDRQFLTAELPLIPGRNNIQIEWQDPNNASKKVSSADIFNEPI
jgi:hypothetical protein